MFLNLVRRKRIPPEHIAGELRFNPAHSEYEFLRTLQATKKKREQLMRERDERLTKGERVFLMATVTDPRKTKGQPSNRSARRFRDGLIRRLLKVALRRQRQVTKEQQERADKEVDEAFERRPDSGLVVPKRR